ncbi:MAG: hypothetical protein ACK4MW_01010 [Aquificaceae bacterium]
MTRFIKICSALAGLFLFSCSSTVDKKGEGMKFIGNIETCQKVKMDVKPAVCGRCILKYEGDKLYIIPTQDCPPYEAYKCKTKDGKSFSINNFSCEPRWQKLNL